MKYSLANYILSIQQNDPVLAGMFNNIFIGGEGSATDSITISLDNNLWSTDTFATGAYIHNKNLSRTGTAVISISQLSDRIAKFKQMCQIHYGGDYSGFTMSLTDSNGEEVCSCVDCYFQKIPDQAFGETAARQSWTILVGEVNYN